MKKTFLYSLGLGVLALGTFLTIAPDTHAYRGDPSVQGPNYSAERHETMETAFEKNDYNAWKKLMGTRGRVTQVVNEKNFAQFAKAHELAEQGKVAEANKIKAELGLGLQNGANRGNGMGRHQNSR